MIYIFRTSVKTKKAAKTLSPSLNKLLQKAYWNFDLEDCDKILRIDSQIEISKPIIHLFQEKGYKCEELSD